ncbi:hypothetical protein ASJ33_07570 [Dehalococcoides mccartyi]|nr:hypothetical protein ASJ33_07570 [Dehalococcoides mccartyi]
MSALIKQSSLQFLFIATVIAIVQFIVCLSPSITRFPAIVGANPFLKALWQVHASILSMIVVVITIIIPVIVNEENRTHTLLFELDDKKRTSPLNGDRYK